MVVDLFSEFSFKAVALAAVVALEVTVESNVLMFVCKVVSAFALMVASFDKAAVSDVALAST